MVIYYCIFVYIYCFLVDSYLYLHIIEYHSFIKDEIFHIPQAMQYCGGNFHDWDSNITTYPGLYLTSYGVMRAMNAILLGYHRIYCSTLFLRSMNILLSCTLPIIYYYSRLKVTLFDHYNYVIFSLLTLLCYQLYS